jgi:hypothetical protein
MINDESHTPITQGENARAEFKEELTDAVLDGLSTDIGETAEIIAFQSHPLTEHHGHGSVKEKQGV